MYGTAFYNSAQYNTGGGLFVELSLSETSNISDVLFKYAQKSALAETTTLADTIAKSFFFAVFCAESFGLSDVLIKDVRKELEQAVNLSDDERSISGYIFEESLSESDTLLNQSIKSFLEFQFMFDTVSSQRYKLLGETVKMNDWLTVGKDQTTWTH